MTVSELITVYRFRLSAACATRDAQALADVAYETMANFVRVSKMLDKSESAADTLREKVMGLEQSMAEMYTAKEHGEEISDLEKTRDSELEDLRRAHAETPEALSCPPRLPAPIPRLDVSGMPAHLRTSASRRWVRSR